MKHEYHVTTTRNFPDDTDQETTHVVKLTTEVGQILSDLLAEHANCQITSFIMVVA